MIVCGVIVSASSVVRRSRTTRSIRYRPIRNASWISSPTVRRRRLPKCSYSSRCSSTASRGRLQRLRRVVLDVLVELLGDAEDVRQPHQLAHQREDVVVRERAHVEVDVQAQPRVQLVAAHARQVVALRIEEQLVQQRARVVHRRRLARTLLLEQLDQRALLRARDLGVRVDRVADVQRVVEELEDLFVASSSPSPAAAPSPAACACGRSGRRRGPSCRSPAPATSHAPASGSRRRPASPDPWAPSDTRPGNARAASPRRARCR